MIVTNIIFWVFLGVTIGWLCGFLLKGRGLGLIGNMVTGIAGSFIGLWFAEFLGIAGTVTGEVTMAAIISAVLGAFVLVMLISALNAASMRQYIHH